MWKDENNTTLRYLSWKLEIVAHYNRSDFRTLQTACINYSGIFDGTTHTMANNIGRSPCKRRSQRVISMCVSASGRAILGESLGNRKPLPALDR